MIQIENIQTEYGTINISQNRSTRALIYEVDGRRQGAMDESGVSLAYYIHAFFDLLAQVNANNILIIGGAACTLGTMLVRAKRKATIVDINPASFVVAKQHFGRLDSVVCRVADGEFFLRNETGTYDAIVLDAFNGDAIPSHLQTPQFFGLIRERLVPGGAAFANVLIKHHLDNSADRVGKNMKTVWSNVRVLDATGIPDRNAIVMGGEVSRLREPRLLIPPKTNPKIIREELAQMQFRAWKASN